MMLSSQNMSLVLFQNSCFAAAILKLLHYCRHFEIVVCSFLSAIYKLLCVLASILKLLYYCRHFEIAVCSCAILKLPCTVYRYLCALNPPVSIIVLLPPLYKKIDIFCLMGRLSSLPWDFLRFDTVILHCIRIIVGHAGFEHGPLPQKSGALPISCHISKFSCTVVIFRFIARIVTCVVVTCPSPTWLTRSPKHWSSCSFASGGWPGGYRHLQAWDPERVAAEA